jgi:DNA-3-methyladenine glycosylase
MLLRRGFKSVKPTLTSGPGSLSKALGITTVNNTSALYGDEIGLEDAPELKTTDYVATTRIGVDYAGADALLPWRFYDSRSAFVSKR